MHLYWCGHGTGREWQSKRDLLNASWKIARIRTDASPFTHEAVRPLDAFSGPFQVTPSYPKQPGQSLCEGNSGAGRIGSAASPHSCAALLCSARCCSTSTAPLPQKQQLPPSQHISPVP